MEGLLDSNGTGLSFNPKDESMLDESKVNQFIQYSIKSWKILGYTDDELWLTFREDFEGWAEKYSILNILTDYLRENGVFVTKGPGIKITKSLMEVLKETDMHRWSQEEIEYQQRMLLLKQRYQPMKK
ncbi:hypothetical protein GcM3_005029 [Golovinomyces cichoracearum]|uniref:Uncharacterized protein n=1 Tax=Golovinomyces cichoracearum TaxID=62708 RepID=A0A420JAW2_9PEZI|nr:hypothetical protein GcM3_005029 [Golovinomyces cichoracearum]